MVLPLTPLFYQHSTAVKQTGSVLLEMHAREPMQAEREVDLLIDMYAFNEMEWLVRSNIEETICDFFVSLDKPRVYLDQIFRFASIRATHTEKFSYERHFARLIINVRLNTVEKLKLARIVLPPSSDYEREMWQQSAWDIYGSIDRFKNLYQQGRGDEGILSTVSTIIEADPDNAIPELAEWMNDHTKVGGNQIWEITGNYLYNYRERYGQKIIQSVTDVLIDIGYFWERSNIHDLLGLLCKADPAQFDDTIISLNKRQPFCYENDSVLHTLLAIYLNTNNDSVPPAVRTVLRDVWNRGYVSHKSPSLAAYLPGNEKEGFEFLCNEIRQKRYYSLYTFQSHFKERFDECINFFEHIVEMSNYFSFKYLDELLLLLHDFKGTDHEQVRLANLFEMYLEKEGFDRQRFSLMLEFQLRYTHGKAESAYERFEAIAFYVLKRWNREQLNCVLFYITTVFQHLDKTAIPVREKFLERLIALREKKINETILDGIVKNNRTVIQSLRISVFRILSALAVTVGKEALKTRLRRTVFSSESASILERLATHHADEHLSNEFLEVMEDYKKEKELSNGN